jgi:ABC-2 type transport system ATP-binding protein
LLADVVRAVDAAGARLTDLALRRPSLDDVFLTLTGHTATSEDSDAEDSTRHGRKASR